MATQSLGDGHSSKMGMAIKAVIAGGERRPAGSAEDGNRATVDDVRDYRGQETLHEPLECYGPGLRSEEGSTGQDCIWRQIHHHRANGGDGGRVKPVEMRSTHRHCVTGKDQGGSEK